MVRFLLLFFLCALGAAAQEPVPDSLAVPGLPDPTVPNERLADVLGQPGGAAPAPAAPSLRLCGRMLVEGAPPVALLEVEGACVLVSEGSELSVSGRRGQVSLTVLALDAERIELDVDGLSDPVILR